MSSLGDRPNLSQHPVDRLIRELVRLPRAATDDEVDAIVARMAAASFSMSRRNVPLPLRALMRASGHALPDRGNDLLVHWAKHVLGDLQWTRATTADEYYRDAIAAAQHPLARLLAQPTAHRHDVVVAIAPTADVVPRERIGPHGGDDLIVVYSASDGRMLSAYMVTHPGVVTQRPGTVWLRS